MASRVTVLIARPERLAAIRDGLRLPGHVLAYSSANLASAFESIRAHQPGMVVLDALFAPTVEGRAFSDRVKQLSTVACEIRLVALVNGVWTLTQTADQRPILDVEKSGLNTRRVPRFRVIESLQAVVEGHTTNVVNISVCGVQVLSEPVLRPNQRIKVMLPDAAEALRLTGHVAWSVYEKPKQATEPYYRAGMEFDGATAQVLEAYCRRYVDEQAPPAIGTT